MDELGVLSPVGFWDPFGYATSPEQFRRYREVEIKHGRLGGGLGWAGMGRVRG